MTRFTTTASLLALAFLGSACGGPSTDASASPPAGQTVVVTTLPADTTVAPGGGVRFTAQVSGSSDTRVVWSVDEAGGGTIDATGLYVAPATEGTYHVRAEHVSQVSADPALAPPTSKKGGTSVVRVAKLAAGQGVVVSVSPGSVTVPALGSATFAATVTGTANVAVTWSVREGSICGSISSTGVYTAPDAGASCTVVATSLADATVSGTAAVTVSSPGAHVVTITPSSASVLTGGTVSFSATVSTGASGESTAVNWSVPAGAGSITAAGVYTAPAAPGTYTVTATSVATPVGTATATVTVTAPAVVAVSVSPATTSVVAGGSVTFSASVTGTTNTAVTWSVPAGAGSITAAGVYTAPASAGTYTVTATSVADGTKKGTATVTVTAPVTISINPTVATLDACRGQVFTATVTGSSNSAVTWSVVEAGGGTVTNGAYVAPSTAGTYHVMAVSQADPTKTVQATVTVGAERIVSVAVTPGSGTVQANGQLTFAATVTTSCGTFAAQ